MLSDLSVHLITWNVAGRDPTEDLTDVLGLVPNTDGDVPLPDVFAVGLQEVNTKPHSMLMGMIFEDPWSKAFRETLAEHDYVKVKSIRLQGLLLILFTRRTHLTYLRGVQTEYTKTGLGRLWGNKGGVTIRASVYGCSVCVVDCHLAAHDYELKQRVEDYNTIVDSQLFSDPETENILYHDYIFWIGDLNFRICDLEPKEIQNLVENEEYDRLLEKDQLNGIMKSGEAFSEFREMKPAFKPSYKYRIGSDDYDLLRRPSWTDRILYKVNPDVYENVTLEIEAKRYDVHQSYILSDHKPVSAKFSIKVFEGYVEKGVDFDPVDTWILGQDAHCLYKLNEKAESTSWDWIGLFRARFSSLDDYATYVWAAPSGTVDEDEQQNDQDPSRYKVTFSDLNVSPGIYRLLYVSNDFNNILGMSQEFYVKTSD